MKRVLFVSVHADDETLGCGGTILRCKAEGYSIFWLNLTGGSLSHPYGFTQELLDIRERQIKQVVTKCGFEDYEILNHPTQMLDTVEYRLVVGDIERVMKRFKPEMVFIPNGNDVHTDHKCAFNAVYSCTKSFRHPYIKNICIYETLSETEFAPSHVVNPFIPNHFVDISEYMEGKLELMRIYDTELMPDPYPRSVSAIKGLAAFRGSRIGVKYAEAYMSIFSVGI